jgi:hypothetical protein
LIVTILVVIPLVVVLQLLAIVPLVEMFLLPVEMNAMEDEAEATVGPLLAVLQEEEEIAREAVVREAATGEIAMTGTTRTTETT